MIGSMVMLTDQGALLLHSAITLGLPLAVGLGVGTLAGRRRVTRWGHHAGYGLAALVAASFLSYVAMSFGMQLWIRDARPGDFASGPGELVAGFVYYGWISAIVAALPTLGGYAVGYLRASDRDSAPKGNLVLPAPPREQRPTP